MTTTTHKFPWINTGAKTVLYLLKNRIKAPRVVPAQSTGDAAADDATRREFERVKEQLNADYQDQRAALTDLEPLVYELAEQVQGWMGDNEARLAEREERMMQMMLMASRSPSQTVGMPGSPSMTWAPPAAHALPAPVAQPAAPASASQPTSPYEGQLLRGDGTQPVYKIEAGRKRWIVTEEALLRNGYSWAQVHVVPKQTVDAIPFGTNIT